MYRSLGLDVFPYDTRTVPFTGWNNPALWTPSYDYLVDRVHTFGVRLSEYLVVIDIDADRGGDLGALEDAFGELPPTLTVVTPSGAGNMHLMFRSSVPLRTNKKLSKQFPGIDFLALGSNAKGATSVRYRGSIECTMYKLQRPVLDPAPLPAALELEWADGSPSAERDVWDSVISDSLADTPKQLLTRREKQHATTKIREALRKIRTAESGNRHDVLYRSARDVFQQAVLLGKRMSDYEASIREAYEKSGGTDYGELDRNMLSVSLWVAQHPIPKPGATAYHQMQTREIGLWADYALAATRPEDKRLRALILALANEATTGFNMTTAGEVIARRYPGVGDRQQVVNNMHWLRDRRFLLRNGEQETDQGFSVPHYRLGRRTRDS